MALSVANKCEEKTDHNVYNPSVDTPVEQGKSDRILGPLIIRIPAKKWHMLKSVSFVKDSALEARHDLSTNWQHTAYVNRLF